MKKNLSNTEKPSNAEWTKYITSFERHVAKKKLRYAYKIELKNFAINAESA